MFKFNTITNKTITLIFTIFLLFIVIDTAYQFTKIKSHSFSILDKMNTTLNALIVHNASAYVYNHDIENLQRTIDAIESDYVKTIYILDKDANIIVESKKSTPSTIRHAKFDILMNDENKSIKNTREYLILNAFNILDVPIGYMILEADLQAHDNHVREEVTILVFGALFWLTIFFILSVLISKSLSRPIHEIIEILKEAKDQDVLTFPIQPQDEFKFLTINIAKTHNRLRSSNKNLEDKVNEKTNELQELNLSLENRIKEEIEKNRIQNEQMFQQSRLAQMGEMISMIAHQWRQPLGAISTTAVNLQMKIDLEAFDLETEAGRDKSNNYFHERLENINNYVNSLTNTIDDFRNFYKPNKKSTLVKLDEVILKALSIIKASLKNDNIEIKEEYDSTYELEVYDGEMMQVILNILKNAQDNFREKGINRPKIIIKTVGQTISICDNGGGIPEGIMGKIFDPYFSTKDEKNGTGLGLYMSKTIIEEHHDGHLDVHNIDDGVCFTIKLGKLNEKS